MPFRIRIFRHPFGWFVFVAVVVLVFLLGKLIYGDHAPVDVVQNYVHEAVKGDWQKAKQRTTGPLQQRLQALSFSQVQKANLLKESYTLTQQDYGKRISEVQADIVVQLQDGKTDIQHQKYALYHPKGQDWKIYRVDSSQEGDAAGRFFPLGKEKGKQTILDFMKASAVGDWHKVEGCVTGEALQNFEKSKNALPKKWSREVTIVHPQMTYLGRSLWGNDVEYLVQYGVKNQGESQVKQITARIRLVSWSDSYFVDRIDIMQEGTQG
jgi:hypothetical protein